MTHYHFASILAYLEVKELVRRTVSFGDKMQHKRRHSTGPSMKTIMPWIMHLYLFKRAVSLKRFKQAFLEVRIVTINIRTNPWHTAYSHEQVLFERERRQRLQGECKIMILRGDKKFCLKESNSVTIGLTVTANQLLFCKISLVI